MNFKNALIPLTDTKIPNPPFEELIPYYIKYEIEIPEVNYRIDMLSDGMVNVINNIKFFSCTYKNIFRQTQTYFSNFISIFFV